MTFDVFGDFESRGYLRNTAGLKDPRAVKEFEHRAYVRNIATAVEHLKNVEHINYQDILDTHKILFQERIRGRAKTVSPRHPTSGYQREATTIFLPTLKTSRPQPQPSPHFLE